MMMMMMNLFIISSLVTKENLFLATEVIICTILVAILKVARAGCSV